MADKTFKRETAVALLVYLMSLATFAAVKAPEKAMDLVEILVYPFVMFAAGAFGLDFITKMDALRPTKRSDRGVDKDDKP